MHSLKSECCLGFVDSYSGLGAIDAAQDKMGIDVKERRREYNCLHVLFILFTL